MNLKKTVAGMALVVGLVFAAPREAHAEPLIFCSEVGTVRDAYGRTGTLWMCYVLEERPWVDWGWYEVVW